MHRDHDQITGHDRGSSQLAYGRKGTINANQMAAISALEPEIVKQMREILLAAKARAEKGELIVLKPQRKGRTDSAQRSR